MRQACYFGIGPISPWAPVIGDGKLKRNGIDNGRIGSRRTGKKSHQYDAVTVEKHIADVLTAHGLVVEFQRSTIDPSEVKAHENFYQRMMWVIDGAKSEFDCVHFSNMRSHPDKNGFALF